MSDSLHHDPPYVADALGKSRAAHEERVRSGIPLGFASDADHCHIVLDIPLAGVPVARRTVQIYQKSEANRTVTYILGLADGSIPALHEINLDMTMLGFSRNNQGKVVGAVIGPGMNLENGKIKIGNGKSRIVIEDDEIKIFVGNTWVARINENGLRPAPKTRSVRRR